MEYTLGITGVDCDDRGDSHWRYHAVLEEGGREIWSDYFHEEPDLREVLHLAYGFLSMTE